MATRNVKILSPTTGKMVDGIEMDVDESSERWSEFTLPDRTVIRAKITMLTVTRVVGEYDQEGNPAYVMKGAPTMVIGSVPDNLKKKTQ
jgi:hypothetical protein